MNLFCFVYCHLNPGNCKVLHLGKLFLIKFYFNIFKNVSLKYKIYTFLKIIFLKCTYFIQKGLRM